MFGQFIKDRRLAAGYTLRSFCEQYGYDPGNHSRLERGHLNPPDDEAWMDRMAGVLGIDSNSSDYHQLVNLASVARRQIPKALLDDAEVAAKLPLLFRTLQGERLPKDKREELVALIRSRA